MWGEKKAVSRQNIPEFSSRTLLVPKRAPVLQQWEQGAREALGERKTAPPRGKG